MREEYLHYLFKNNALGNEFITAEGQVLKIINKGQYNTNSGPDFTESRVEFDGKTWAGHIEFHVKSSDWELHGHQNDPVIIMLLCTLFMSTIRTFSRIHSKFQQ